MHRITGLAGAAAAAMGLWVAGVAAAGESGSAEAASAVVAAAMTADEAYERVRASIEGGRRLEDGEGDAAAAAIEEAHLVEPSSVKWLLGMVMVEIRRADAKGARAMAEKAVALAPDSADAQYWLGTAIFSGINDAGLLDKGSLAGKGKKAFERAAEIDPAHIGARTGLAQFYANAPGIVGGSKAKAKEQAEALLRIPGGALRGRLVLAQLAIGEKDWDALNRVCDEALDATGDPFERSQAHRQRLLGLLRTKKDGAMALPYAERYAEDAAADDFGAPALLGEARHMTGDFKGAAEALRTALAINPDLGTSRFLLAASLAEVGDKPGAIAEYEEFVRRFPEDKRASEAKKAIKKLKK